jgi:cephalosporin-C deacetylase-like acetyl esterase
MVILFLSAFLIEVAFARAGEIAKDKDIRADFLKMIDRPRVPAAAVEIAAVATTQPAEDELYFTYSSDAKNRVPGILVRTVGKASGKKPVVILLHGTGGKKEDELPLMRKLAAKGFIAVAIDGPYHGERTKAGKGSDEYQAAILRAWHDQKEHPFFFDTVWDVMRLIDYLQTRGDVDGSRIGLYGVSKGGIETYLTAAVDPRVSVAVPCIGMESFQWAVENNSWKSRIGTIQHAFDSAAKEANVEAPGAEFVHQFYERVAPGLDREFDGPAMAPLVAPRALLLINGEVDPRTPAAGLKLCTDAAESAYRAAGASDHFAVRIQPKTGHKVNPDSQDAAVEWFVKWLKP